MILFRIYATARVNHLNNVSLNFSHVSLVNSSFNLNIRLNIKGKLIIYLSKIVEQHI